MKRISFLTVFIIVMFFTSNSFVFAEEKSTETIDGGILIDYRTMLPLRTIFETLDAKVHWNAKDQSITVRKNTVTIKLQVNSKTAKVNGITTTLDVAPVIYNGRTLVPVRFVTEALNATVSWDSKNSVVMIDTLEKVIYVNVQLTVKDFRTYQGTWTNSTDDVNGDFVNLDFETETRAKVWVATGFGSASVNYMNYREASTEEHIVRFNGQGEASFNFQDTYDGRSGTAYIKLEDNKVTVTIIFQEHQGLGFLFSGTKEFNKKR